LANEPIRNPALIAALDAAVARGDRGVLALICRHSGLPGPRPNFPLAAALGRHVASYGARADALLRELCAGSPDAAPAGAAEYLPICGAQALAARYLAQDRPQEALSLLRAMAEDTRRLVREGVIAALSEIAHARAGELVSALRAWTDEYLPAAVALEGLSTRGVLDRISTPEELLSRLDEAFILLEGASRSDQRSQGYRELVRTLADASANIMGRFADKAGPLLEARAATAEEDLRALLESAVEQGRRQGQAGSRFAELEKSLEASAPPRRDPRTYVGPTRQRGQKGAKKRR
jgi:hypothetical protein